MHRVKEQTLLASFRSNGFAKVSYFSFEQAAKCDYLLCKVSHRKQSTARLDNWDHQPDTAARTAAATAGKE
jgi:hypothetical protein